MKIENMEKAVKDRWKSNVIGMDFTGLLLSFMLLACVLTLYANVVMALLGEFQRREESE